MGLFKKIKKAFKKIVGGVKKVVKKVVKGVKKVAKKIGSSKILKALAIAAAVVVTGGAAIGAFTGGTATGFAGWMMNASNAVSSGALFGSAAGKTGAAKFFTQAGNFITKTAAKPFASAGKTIGNITAGITDFTGLTTEAGRTGLTPEEVGFFEEDIFADAGSKVAKEGATIQQAVTDPSTYAEASPSNRFLDTRAGKFVSNVGTSVATNVFTGAAMQSIVGDPEMTGAIGGSGRQEGSSNFDPLRIYAATNGIDVGSIYNQPLYGNSDPSSIYGTELYNQQTVGVA
jgi:hypothetical protein